MHILQLTVCNKRFLFIEQRFGTEFTKRAYRTTHNNFLYNINIWIMYNHKEAKMLRKKLSTLNWRNLHFFIFSYSCALNCIFEEISTFCWLWSETRTKWHKKWNIYLIIMSWNSDLHLFPGLCIVYMKYCTYQTHLCPDKCSNFWSF